MIPSSYFVNTKVGDDLVMQGVRASAAIVSHNIHLLASEGLTQYQLYQ